jgi:hypothetical protein
MKTKFVQLDLVQTKANWPAGRPFRPAYVKKFKHGQPSNWSVVDAPVKPGTPISWAHTYHDEYLRVPLFSYMLHRQTDRALATMLALGLECAGQLTGQAQELLLVTGVPVELCYAADQQTFLGLRYYVGFAVR